MNGDVTFTGLRVGGVAHTESKVGAGIFRSIGGRRQYFQDIEIRIGRQVNDFLTRGLVAWDDYRRNRVGNGVF